MTIKHLKKATKTVYTILRQIARWIPRDIVGLQMALARDGAQRVVPRLVAAGGRIVRPADGLHGGGYGCRIGFNDGRGTRGDWLHGDCGGMFDLRWTGQRLSRMAARKNGHNYDCQRQCNNGKQGQSAGFHGSGNRSKAHACNS